MAWNPGYQCGKYTIDKTLGEGGFCITYQAHDSKGQKFALKTLNDDVQKRHDFDKHQQDFVNESLKIKQFDHPHIVKVYELIQQGRLWCVVMEYIDGGDLANYVVNNGLLSEQKALRYIQQIGDALHLVHQRNLLHRDIKPQNIMLRKATDDAVLIDFGIAREFEQNVTKTHTQYLTEGFAPVEQYNNVSKRGAYTDIYALAATLYWLLTASVPAPALDRQASIGQHRRDILQPPKTINPNISDKVNSAILKGLNVEPKHPRPQYMIDWLRMLGLDLIVPPPSPGKTDIPKFWVVGIIATASLIVTVATKDIWDPTKPAPTSTYTPPPIPTSTYTPPPIPTSTYTPPPIPSPPVSIPPSPPVSIPPSPPVSIPPSPPVSVPPSPPVSVPPSSGPYTEIKSEVGAEPQLQELEQLLKQGDFKAADEKTGKIMLYVANRENEGYIDSDSIAKFSCTDLRTIDQLWVNNSNGRFGFSVQKRIREENGKKNTHRGKNVKWFLFFEAIGWWDPRGKEFVPYGERYTFALNAPEGHLPGQRGLSSKIILQYAGVLAGVFDRVDACKM